jgi:hypothetical protein
MTYGQGGQTVPEWGIGMAGLIIVLLLALISVSAGFALRVLWWITVVVAILRLLGFVRRVAEI